MRFCNVFAASALVAFSVNAQQPSSDSAIVSAVVDGFHAAIRMGDAAAAMKLVADDAVMLEAGGIETRAEYAMNHLPEDIKFEKVVASAYKSYRVTVLGNVAWAISTSDMKGTFEEKPVNSAGAELMVLSRGSDGWRIRAIHWSSRRR